MELQNDQEVNIYALINPIMSYEPLSNQQTYKANRGNILCFNEFTGKEYLGKAHSMNEFPGIAECFGKYRPDFLKYKYCVRPDTGGAYAFVTHFKPVQP